MKEHWRLLKALDKGEIDDEYYNIALINCDLDTIEIIVDYLNVAIDNEDDSVVYLSLELIWHFQLFKDYGSRLIPLLCKLITVTWHAAHQDICHLFQVIKDTKCVPYLDTALQERYEDLDDEDDDEADAEQMLYALATIGTSQALLILERFKDNCNFRLKNKATELYEMKVSS